MRSPVPIRPTVNALAPRGPARANRAVSAWPATLAVDVALGIDSMDTIFDRYGLQPYEWDIIANTPAFKAELVATVRELRESGLSFKRKAAAQAETYLEDMEDLMSDATVPPSVKVDIFKTLARLGELEPKEAAGGPGGAGGVQFNLQINLAP